MNLHAVAGPIVGVVNPPVIGKVHISRGYTTLPSGKRAPDYDTRLGVSLQVQALTGPELKQLDGLNIVGVKRGVYLSGDFEALNRAKEKGGDLLEFGGATWLVVMVFETWPDWCKVAVVEQTNGA